MTRIFKKIVLFALLAVLVLSMSACGGEQSEIKALTTRFEKSCNKLELNEMLDCIEPDVAQGVKAITGVIGMFTDADTDELLDKFGAMLFSEMPENSKEFFSSIKITVNDVEVDKDNATASAEIAYEISGEESVANAYFEYVRIEEEWYITNLDLE